MEMRETRLGVRELKDEILAAGHRRQAGSPSLEFCGVPLVESSTYRRRG